MIDECEKDNQKDVFPGIAHTVSTYYFNTVKLSLYLMIFCDMKPGDPCVRGSTPQSYMPC